MGLDPLHPATCRSGGSGSGPAPGWPGLTPRLRRLALRRSGGLKPGPSMSVDRGRFRGVARAAADPLPQARQLGGQGCELVAEFVVLLPESLNLLLLSQDHLPARTTSPLLESQQEVWADVHAEPSHPLNEYIYRGDLKLRVLLNCFAIRVNCSTWINPLAESHLASKGLIFLFENFCIVIYSDCLAFELNCSCAGLKQSIFLLSRNKECAH